MTPRFHLRLLQVKATVPGPRVSLALARHDVVTYREGGGGEGGEEGEGSAKRYRATQVTRKQSKGSHHRDPRLTCPPAVSYRSGGKDGLRGGPTWHADDTTRSFGRGTAGVIMKLILIAAKEVGN